MVVDVTTRSSRAEKGYLLVAGIRRGRSIFFGCSGRGELFALHS